MEHVLTIAYPSELSGMCPTRRAIAAAGRGFFAVLPLLCLFANQAVGEQGTWGALADGQPAAGLAAHRSAPGAAVSDLFVACPGDCDQSGEVDVTEIVTIVDVILGNAPPAACPALLGAPTIVEAIRAVNSALQGCPLVVRYRLGDGSTIFYSAPSMTVSEPLSGSFTIVQTGFEPQFSDFAVASLHFQSTHFVVIPDVPEQVGTVQIPITVPPVFEMDVTARINGDTVELSGSTEFGCCSTAPPALEDLQICGAPTESSVSCDAIQNQTAVGYIVTIFAVPEG
jgi:hypothetical protein